MKKILLAVVLLCASAFAQPSDSDLGYWPRSYFASIGFGVIANRGDFFDPQLQHWREHSRIFARGNVPVLVHERRH